MIERKKRKKNITRLWCTVHVTLLKISNIKL